jgi:hypothetical protein
VLSPAGGSFAEPIEIAIREPVAGASIAYTFEEGPRPHWLLYSGPIPIRASTRLRVRAVRYGWAESDEVEARYEIRAADAAAH